MSFSLGGLPLSKRALELPLPKGSVQTYFRNRLFSFWLPMLSLAILPAPTRCHAQLPPSTGGQDSVSPRRSPPVLAPAADWQPILVLIRAWAW